MTDAPKKCHEDTDLHCGTVGLSSCAGSIPAATTNFRQQKRPSDTRPLMQINNTQNNNTQSKTRPLLNWPKLTFILILARLLGVVVLLLYRQSLSSLYHQYNHLQQYVPPEQV